MSKEAMKGYIIVGKHEFKLSYFKSVTLEDALKTHVGVDVSDSSIKKVWKIANGYTIPNHLKKKLKAENK